MSYHLVHILNHGSRLFVDRGCLVCKSPDKDEKRIPKADLLALIIAARGITFSSDCLSRLAQQNCIILHCDDSYKPIAKTAGFSQIVHSQIFQRQIEKDEKFNNKLWQSILKAKITNQAILLDGIKKEHKLWDYLKESNPDEGNTARHYWERYFKMFGRKGPKVREHRGAKSKVNQMLNYSYAVMGAILHRGILAHGLHTTLGIHHRYRFKTDPLVYDLIEPLRPICDYLFLNFYLNNTRRNIEDWVKDVAQKMINFRIKINNTKSVKLIYSIDRYVSSVANCFFSGETEINFLPMLNKIYFDERNQV
jgi:CRISP-associated protein Cas1